MSDVQTKICGIRDEAALAAAVDGGAAYVGFVFFPPSPRAIEPKAAGLLAASADGRVQRVGLFVDATDVQIAATLADVDLDALQLHGGETPRRARDVKARFGLPVIKALPIAGAEDVAAAAEWRDSADILLFDAKPPNREDALPGGNAETFDWDLLKDASLSGPWMLSGGLTPENVGHAIAQAKPPIVDVSSGVEVRRGEKGPALIRAFLEAVRGAT